VTVNRSIKFTVMRNNYFIRVNLSNVFFIISLIGVLTVTVVTFSFFSTSDKNDEGYQNVFQQRYSIFALDLPVDLVFAGEKVPLDKFDVKESFDREMLVNTYWQSQTLLFIKRANRFFPIIEPILKKHAIPDDFKYLAVAESGLTNSVSSAGAVGVWQFMRGTALDYGLEINNEVDERYHLEKSTEAACNYLRDSYDKYGSWAMVAASYNAGRNAIDVQLERQKASNYYDLLLGEETGRYVFRILALKTILNDPEKFGFHFREKHLYPTFQTYQVEVDTVVLDFAKFAIDHDTNYKILKKLNPWLRQSFLTNKYGKKYIIKLPVDGFRENNKFVQAPDTIYNSI